MLYNGSNDTVSWFVSKQDRCLIRWTEVFLINTGERPGATINGL